MNYEASERLQKLPPYLFVRLEQMTAKKRAEGIDIIDFGIGDPDLATPDAIVKTLQEEVAKPENQKYSSSQGEKCLRQAIADWYAVRFGVEVDPDTEVCVTLGSKEAIFNISQAFVNCGETIIAPSPGYPVYSAASPIFNEAKCASVPLRAEKDWLLDVDDCPKGARMLYANYPNNPTGATCDLDYLKKLQDWCRDNNTIFCYDNAYSEMCFDGYLAPSALEAGMDCIEFGSFSKTFNMTGYRLGYAVGNKDLIAGLKKCKGQIDSGAPVFVQKAGITGLKMYTGRKLPEVIENNMKIYAERRNTLVNGFREMGFDVKMPRGTFYVWFDTGMTSLEFTEKCLEAGVVCTPGSGFGASAEGYVRFAITQPVERTKEALARLKEIL
ncbi:MAG: aminotransferase class I/II-fold pyridoxal phosphate-dependent enzyme [Candidatus Methanomethylophilaceae archaeon]|nr:aminotransferase class I/II-fold pyridoxal phosphate-dependent enzyme [Candidatus Methanomethylophilaceae archaeon]